MPFFSCLRTALERPTETAMLLSLTGVVSVIAPQWYTSLEENAERLETLFESKCLWCVFVICVCLSLCVFCFRHCCVCTQGLCVSASPFFAPYQIVPGVSTGGEVHAGATMWLTG